MIVTCPSCAKRYMLDDALLPKEGRQVRCITCLHIWHQNREISSYQTNLPFIGFNEDVVLSIKSSRSGSSRKFWFLFLGLFFISVSFLILGRNAIVPIIPSIERYYDLLGLPVNIVGSGLMISNATSHIHQEGPLEMIVFSGDLVNTSSRVRPIPPLKIMVVGEGTKDKCLDVHKDKGCVLEAWDHRLSERSLLPGEQIHFETAPRPKIEGTSHISIEF